MASIFRIDEPIEENFSLKVSSLKEKRVILVQYAADIRQIYNQVSTSDHETYYGHRYVITSLVDIGSKIGEIAALCCHSQESYSEILEQGFRAIGAGVDPYQDTGQIIQLLEQYQPTHLVLCAPIIGVLRWAVRRQIKTITLFADSFLDRGLRRRLKNFRLAKALNNSCVEWVGNHNVNACRSLDKIGVNPNKIIPWDWPYSNTPEDNLPKSLKAHSNHCWNLIYVGSMAPAKGVTDLLEAVSKLADENVLCDLKLVGQGDIDYFSDKAKQLKIEKYVTFMGLVDNHTVRQLMREADVVLIPSRHEYPEGLPLTIYEALCARTPIVASDHPMFQGILEDKVSAMVFPAGHSAVLADCIKAIMTDKNLYQKLSEASLSTWQKIQIPVKWADVIDRWVHDACENRRWLFEHRLNSGLYD
jgi:glycosyltransferase involved in cell wall biosynthesis